MRLLQRGRTRFEHRLKTLPGIEFRGTIQPISETALSVDTFAEPRLLLRVRNQEPVKNGDLIFDPNGRVLLVGNHDQHLFGATQIDRVHKLFQMTEEVRWTRERTVIEPITGRARSDGDQLLGMIWVSRELYGREDMDRGLRVAEDRQRIITGSEIRLDDKIGDATVRRLNLVYGVRLAEVQ